MADCANEFLEESRDHFGGHPKTAGRTFTGGAESFFESGNLRAETGNWRLCGRNYGDGLNERLVDKEAETVQADQHRAAFVADNAHREREVDAESSD